MVSCGADKRESLESDQKARSSNARDAVWRTVLLGIPVLSQNHLLGFPNHPARQPTVLLPCSAIMMLGMFMDQANSFCLLGKPEIFAKVIIHHSVPMLTNPRMDCPLEGYTQSPYNLSSAFRKTIKKFVSLLVTWPRINAVINIIIINFHFNPTSDLKRKRWRYRGGCLASHFGE